MKRVLLSAAGAFALAAVAFSGGAHAQCAWNGAYWACGAAPPAAYYGDPYWYWYGSTYPAYGQPDFGWGYKPQWFPSMNGPRASSGAGH